VAQIVAVAIAGFWTYHIYQITGEGEVNPEYGVFAQTFSYSRMRARCWYPSARECRQSSVSLDSDALSLTVKKIPESLKSGPVDMDKEAPMFDVKAFKGYEDGVELNREQRYEDVAEFIVEPGCTTC